jgi:hypothetical protein
MGLVSRTDESGTAASAQVVPGGGAIEMGLSKFLSEYSLKFTNKVNR